MTFSCHIFYQQFYAFLFLIMTLSQAAMTAGKSSKIKIVEQSVPCEIVLQIFAAMADAKCPTINVTITKIDAEVKMV